MDQFTPLDEEFYPDILRGLSVYFDSPFVLNIARTAQKFQRPDLAHALNRKQIACKKWLVDKLVETNGGTFEKVWILGGWYGVLSALMHADQRMTCTTLTSFDIDDDCVQVAECLNREQFSTGNFAAKTGDMLELDYMGECPDLIVNTSCEHLHDFDEWFSKIPEGTLLALQSNDYFGEPDHVSCAENLEMFQAQAKLSQVDYAGELPLKKYTRFMLIGRR